MTQRKQYKRRPPDEIIKGPLTQYYNMGEPDVRITELLKDHYDTEKYGIGVQAVRNLRQRWNMPSTRQQNHTEESIHNYMLQIRERHSTRSAESIRKALRAEFGVRASRTVITKLLKKVEPERVAQRKDHLSDRKSPWTSGVNDVWAQDHHDKWSRFGLWLHAGIETFSSEIQWMQIWWTNKNPRLVAKYYLDACRKAGGVPLTTQSNSAIQNYAVANVHTTIRHRLDPSLDNTLQHQFASGCNNIISKIKWSVFRREFTPGFEDKLEEGLLNGWYDPNNVLESLLFRWVAIPWLQCEIDRWVYSKNRSAPRKVRGKILPTGPPTLIRMKPAAYGAADFKVPVPPELFEEMELLHAPPDHPVFELVPVPFHEHVRQLYSSIGEPAVSMTTFWGIYLKLLTLLRQETWPADVYKVVATCSLTLEPDDVPLLPGMKAHPLDRPIKRGRGVNCIGGVEQSSTAAHQPAVVYADFTDSEDDVPLLPGMEANQLDRPIERGQGVNYNGEADQSSTIVHQPAVEYAAEFTDSEDMEPDDVPLLPGMEAYRLDRPINCGQEVNYMGGVEQSFTTAHQHVVEYAADFTDSEDDVPPLPGMEAHQRDWPINCGREVDYIGGVEQSSTTVHQPAVEYAADFTDSEDMEPDNVPLPPGMEAHQIDWRGQGVNYIGGVEQYSTTAHQPTVEYADFTDSEDGVSLLPGMEAHRLDRPINYGRGVNYNGGVDQPSTTAHQPTFEYADFTDSEDDVPLLPGMEAHRLDQLWRRG